jgi:hypothetical protein
MVGCGTVAVEAALSGKDGFYSDIDPLCCLLTRAKARPVDPCWLLNTTEEILQSCKRVAKPGVKRGRARAWIRDLESSTSFRAPPNVFHWFKPYVVVNLCRLLLRVAETDATPRKRDALLAIVASVIRRVSRADPATASGLEVTKIRLQALDGGLRFDLPAEIRKKAELLAKGYRDLRAEKNLGDVTVVEGDARKWSTLCAKEGIWPDLVITSPCYMSAIEYWRRHKLEYCWLGLVDSRDLKRFRQKFLGMGNADSDVSTLPSNVRRLHSRFYDLGHKREAAGLARYFNDSSAWLAELASVIERTRGTAYVVVGGNCTRGHQVNTPLALQKIAEDVGLSCSVFMRYGIINYHMQYPTKSSRIRNETILRVKPQS